MKKEEMEQVLDVRPIPEGDCGKLVKHLTRFSAEIAESAIMADRSAKVAVSTRSGIEIRIKSQESRSEELGNFCLLHRTPHSRENGNPDLTTKTRRHKEHKFVIPDLIGNPDLYCLLKWQRNE